MGSGKKSQTKVKIGDVIEIKTRKGLAYAQYTHRVEGYSYLIQVKEGFYHERPKSFLEMVNKESTIIKFFPLEMAIKRKIFTVVAHVPVPVRFQKFPVFRLWGGIPDKNGIVCHKWKFWDGKRIWPPGKEWVKKLTREQRQYPIDSIVNDTALIYYIEHDYRPEKDPRSFLFELPLKKGDGAPMGTWGAEIFESDMACDVRDRYQDMMEQGLSCGEATDQLLAEYADELETFPETASIFWLSLAKVQHDSGAIDARIKTKALAMIDEGVDLSSWKELGADEETLKEREQVLQAFRKVLNGTD